MTRRDPITDVPARRALLALLAVVVAGCGDGLCHQDDVAEIAVPAGSRLNAVDLGYFQAHLAEGSMVAVGDDGLVLVASGGYALTEHRPVAVDLRAVAFGPGSQIFAAGAGGTLIRGQLDESTWQTVATGTTADLWRIAWLSVGTASTDGAPNREYVLAVGDGAVLVRDPVDAQWDLVPPPEGGWGRLRAIAGDDRIHVGGLGGVVWSTDDPRGTWTRQDVGTDADLLAGATGWSGEAMLVGARGTIVHRPEGAWVVLANDIEDDFIDLDGVVGLTADGRLHDLVLPDEPETLGWSAPGARAIADDLEIVAVGAGMALRSAPYCGR